ncbi:MAG: 1-(5-phosphoribosyl)-5-[(5-phosphoribosylamino)methylideneamino]imidazole-4-carboxamide isomerase [Dehalococcoidia bacterium]|nr:1-(5-phosphoribosyl)-5-[(5-phosphoribosylamino)methylideneamino]imidazole-4-carboxamide isomerase [Dehalococcoidia bacterium]
MDIIPAIDIKDGKCVRLYQGDYDKETIFSTDPVSVAVDWQEMGAERIHIVDLDGAASGNQRNFQVIKMMISCLAIPVQVGGGIRTESNVVTMMDIGVDRVILGTMAVENKEIVQSIVDRFGVESVIVGIDVRDDLVSIKGWKKSTFVSSSDLMDEMYRIGVRRFVYTDISRDGTLMEPNFQSIEQIVNRSDANIIASGGVSSLGHIKQLAGLGVEGVIIGKALYTGDINLNEAISIY